MMRYFLATILLFLLLLAILNAVPLLLSRPFIFDRQDEVPARETGLVLGAGLTPDGEPSRILKARLDTALRFYRAKKVQKLILTGDNSGPWYKEVRAMKKYLLARGMNAQDMILDPEGLNTLVSARNAKRYLGSRSLIIFTQGFHLPRAVFLARMTGVDAVGFVSDQHISPDRWWYQWREIWARPLAVFQVFFAKK